MTEIVWACADCGYEQDERFTDCPQCAADRARVTDPQSG